MIIAAVVLVLMALLAALGLVVMALVGIVMGAERLLTSLVPAYRRRRRQRYLSMPAGLVRVVRFGARSTQVRFGARSTQVRFGARSTQPIDVRSSESPHGGLEP